MPAESTMHLYFNWAKERLDEMDAALASLEAKVPQAKADAKAKVEQSIADLKKRRDEFAALAKKQSHTCRCSSASLFFACYDFITRFLNVPLPAVFDSDSFSKVKSQQIRCQ